MVLQNIHISQNFSQISQISLSQFFAMPSWSLDLFCKAKKVSNLPFAIPYYELILVQDRRNKLHIIKSFSTF